VIVHLGPNRVNGLMSLFVNGLAFGGSGFETEAKLGVLVGSIISGIGGFAILSAAARGAAAEGAASGTQGEDDDLS